MDAEPLYVGNIPISNHGTHNLLIVATENDSLYGLDADTGARIWRIPLLGGNETPSDNRNCSQVVPVIGITSTPVIALERGGTSGAIFAVALSRDSSGRYHQRLHKVDLATGRPVTPAVEVKGKYPGTGAGTDGSYVHFDPAQYKERAGLLLLGNAVFTSWASHCDDEPYAGWIMAYNTATLKQVTAIDVTPNAGGGAIWGSGAGLAADANGYIYFLDANGVFDTTLNARGFPSGGDYGNAFVKLSTQGGKLSVADYFTMYDTVDESDGDVDLGSGGALVLPDMVDSTGTVRHLAIGAGKDGNIYLVDRNNMES